MPASGTSFSTRAFEPYMLLNYAALAEVVHRPPLAAWFSYIARRQTTATFVAAGSIRASCLTLAAAIA
jgi:hypothetical protein